MIRELIPCIYLLKGRTVTGFGQKNIFDGGDPIALAKRYADAGADAVLVFDFSANDADHDAAIGCIQNICDTIDIPVIGAGGVKRLEDVKKLLYAGCAQVLLNASKSENINLLSEVSARFGAERMGLCIVSENEYTDHRALIDRCASRLLLLDNIESEIPSDTPLAVTLLTNRSGREDILRLLSSGIVTGISGSYVSQESCDFISLKLAASDLGVEMNIARSALPFDTFVLNDQGLIPCIVQDARTDEVLMMAWMNAESFDKTLATGRMTYYSRSRQSLWVKGETSGHFQYLRSLSVDCDRDTLLARVIQVGAACHTGNRSCFYTPLFTKEDGEANPLKVFEHVYNVIEDRKAHPKEGSYTNYLFEKGLDKILKKVGEENAEIIIAAKNENPEEVKYEIADYLYHLMVLMSEKGISWKDITETLAKRE